MFINRAIRKQAAITSASKISSSNWHLNARLLALAADGCFYDDTASRVCPPPDSGASEMLFRHEVFKMLKPEAMINEFIMSSMMGALIFPSNWTIIDMPNDLQDKPSSMVEYLFTFTGCLRQ